MAKTNEKMLRLNGRAAGLISGEENGGEREMERVLVCLFLFLLSRGDGDGGASELQDGG